MSAVNVEAVRKNWHGRGFSCELWSDPPGRVWVDYVHEVDELFMVVEGQEELIFNGRAFCPAVGEEVLIPAGAVHTVRNVGGTTSRWLYGYKRRDGESPKPKW